MEHLIKDEHYTEALRNILRRGPLSNNRKALLLLLEQSAYLNIGKKWECSLFYDKMGTIDIHELMLWIQEEINSLKNAMLESRLAPILDEESPPDDDFLNRQKINHFLLANTNIPNVNTFNNFGDHNVKIGPNNNFSNHNVNLGGNNNFGGGAINDENIFNATEPLNVHSPRFTKPNEQRKPSDEELEYLNLQALKFDNLSSDEDTDVADLIDLNNYIPKPQPPLQEPILIDPIENVKAHFNKNSGNKDTKTIFNTMNSFPGANPVNNFNGANPVANNLGNFNTQIATELLSSFMGNKTTPAGFEPAIRAAFPSPQPQFPIRSPQQAFSAQQTPSDPLLRQASVPGSHDSNRQLSFDSSRQPFSVPSPQAFPAHSPQLAHPQQPFQFGPTPNGHPAVPQNGLSDTPPGFFNALRPPRSASEEQNSTLNHDAQSHIMFGTPESPQLVQTPVIQQTQAIPSPILFSKPIQEVPPPPPQNIFPIIRPKGTLPPPPGLAPLSDPLRQQSQDSNRQVSYESNNRQVSYESNNRQVSYESNNRQVSYESNNRQSSYESNNRQSSYESRQTSCESNKQSLVEGRHASSECHKITSRNESTCSTDTDQDDDYSITTFSNMESKLFKDDNATDIMYQYKVVSQTQLESFVTNGDVKAQIRTLGVFYTISPCSDPNFFVISLSGPGKETSTAFELLRKTILICDTDQQFTTETIELPRDQKDDLHLIIGKKGSRIKMIKDMYPDTVCFTTDSQISCSGLKKDVEAVMTLCKYLLHSPCKKIGMLYKVPSAVDEREIRGEVAKITGYKLGRVRVMRDERREKSWVYVPGLPSSSDVEVYVRKITACC